MLKLVRIDGGLTPPAGSEISIFLPNGIHPFGRGIFLDCEDKRISRQHGHLEVSEDSVLLKALHQNPCFVIKQGTDQTQILKSGSFQSLERGDKFGLLPNTHWYELRRVEPPVDPAGAGSNTQEYAADVKKENEEELIDFPFDDDMEQRRETGSPSLLPQENGQRVEGTGEATSSNPNDDIIHFPEEAEEPSAFAPGSPSLLGQNVDNAAPAQAMKRAHSPEEAAASSAKQTRAADKATEPEDVKPSTSSLHAAMQAAAAEAPAVALAASAPVKKEVKDEPPSPPSPPRQQAPVAPAAPGRERCMYGAQCYRRNAQHKLAFSHPSDADWGAGAQGSCPWGAGCTRRDPRHWRDHTHPPGVAPPAAPGPNRGDANNARPRARPRNGRRDAAAADSQGLDPTNVLPNKRQRKQVRRPSWSGSDSENDYDMDDPFMADDDSDDWVPSDEDTPSDYTQSQ